MAEFTIRDGINLRLAGAPAPAIEEIGESEFTEVYPVEFQGLKPRLTVKEGNKVKRGTALFINKKYEPFRFCSPVQGTIESIVFGHRRVVRKIVIRRGGNESEDFASYEPARIKSISREDALHQLLTSGYLAYIRQRPFSKMADPEAKPKSIFVNGMSSAPFQTDIQAAIQGHEVAFQAGLHLLKRLTDGAVNLILPGDRSDLSQAFIAADGVEIHQFNGRHPCGNTSIHIHHVDPISPKDVVWTIKAVDLIQIGRLFLDGALPTDRVVALGGPGVGPDSRQHYRIRIGNALTTLFDSRLVEGDNRIVNGDVLGGQTLPSDSYLPFFSKGFTVIREDRSRSFLGWLAPGLNRFSQSPLFLSTWFARDREWDLGTSQNGSLRAMVLTGQYDKYLPMNIMVDYLVRAILANDTDEAIKLGILETDPEDFAPCAFACPSKMDLVGIVRRGLELIEEEGL